MAGSLPDRHDRLFRDPRIIAKQIEVESVVRFIGRVAEEDKVALYQQARTFLYPTLYEGFGLPALEALAWRARRRSNASPVPETSAMPAFWLIRRMPRYGGRAHRRVHKIHCTTKPANARSGKRSSRGEVRAGTAATMARRPGRRNASQKSG
jgi:glycosyltransferase involved in cell wall biosynthesis